MQKLFVTVISCENLPKREAGFPKGFVNYVNPSPYVRVFLMPGVHMEPISKVRRERDTGTVQIFL